MSAENDSMAASAAFEEPGSTGEKSKRKCELVDYHSLPEYLKDNEFVVGYYRCEWPLKETILSIFSIHNETVNVWTHLIGFCIFLALTVFTALMVPREVSVSSIKYYLGLQATVANSTAKGHPEVVACLPPPLSEGGDRDHDLPSSEEMQTAPSSWHLPEVLLNCLPGCSSHPENLSNPCLLAGFKEDISNMISPLLRSKPATRWPFFAFLCGAMFCLLTSSICHLILCHSERMAYYMLRLDYTGIAALIVTSFFPPVYYSFLCEPFYCNLYIGFITAFGAAAVTASLVPVFQTPEFRPVRAGLFFCMGVSGVVPIVHKLVAFNHRPEAVITTGYELLMGVFYGLGVTVYATRIPERWMPGKFDLLGHSHQLFHLLVIAGAYTHYLAGLVYLRWRDTEGC